MGFAGAGVVEPDADAVVVELFEGVPNRLLEGWFRLLKSPPPWAPAEGLFSAFVAAEASDSSFFGVKLIGELEAVGTLNRPDVVAAGFWPKVLGALPVLPPNNGVAVPEPGLEEDAKIDGCCVPLVFVVAPPPKMLAVGCDVDVVDREKGDEVAGVEPAPNKPPVIPEVWFDVDPNNGLDGPLPLPPPKVNDMIW